LYVLKRHLVSNPNLTPSDNVLIATSTKKTLNLKFTWHHAQQGGNC